MATGVLLTGFGGPDSLEAVGPFMCNLMGREPSAELVDRVCKRYLAIGGKSPLAEIAAEIAKRLEVGLADIGSPMPVAVGMRYWDPYIEDALAQLKGAGCDKVVVVSLSPFESKVAHGAYREAITAGAEAIGGIEIIEAPLVSSLPEFPDFFASVIAAALTDMQPNEGAIIAFSAHSLPESDLVEGDPYVAGLQQTADAIADRLGLPQGAAGAGSPMFAEFRTYGSSVAPRAWYLVYQSKGNRPGAWLEPDLDDLVDAAAAAGVPAIIVCPIGFMTDHMETLYDLDIVAAGKAMDVDVEFVRVPVPNQDDALIDAIAAMVARLA